MQKASVFPEAVGAIITVFLPRRILKIAYTNKGSGIKIPYMISEITCWLSDQRQKDSKISKQAIITELRRF